MDEPRRHLQDVWGRAFQGRLATRGIEGAPQTGKSFTADDGDVGRRHTLTAQRSAILLPSTLGGGGLIYLENLPHVGGSIVGRTTRSAGGREMQAVVRRQETTFKEHRVGSIGMYRRLCVTIKSTVRPIHTATSF